MRTSKDNALESVHGLHTSLRSIYLYLMSGVLCALD
jgi:hypothetical protein